MITIKFSRDDQIYTVGLIDQRGEFEDWWMPLRDCKTRDEAMAWMSYLNGGVHPNEIEGYWNKTYWQDNAERAMK